jgi:hypothetical protein
MASTRAYRSDSSEDEGYLPEVREHRCLKDCLLLLDHCLETNSTIQGTRNLVSMNSTQICNLEDVHWLKARLTAHTETQTIVVVWEEPRTREQRQNHHRDVNITGGKIKGPLVGSRLWGWQSSSLNDIAERDYRHSTQVFHRSNEAWKYTCATNLTFERCLLPDAPAEKYRIRRPNEHRSTCHWGQRKLLLSEIEFLTLSLPANHDATVIYAGAAPGTHMGILCELFPDAKFILIDPAPFTCNPKTDPALRNVTLMTAMMTDELAVQFKQQYKTLLFISDVRAADHSRMEEEDNERQVMHTHTQLLTLTVLYLDCARHAGSAALAYADGATKQHLEVPAAVGIRSDLVSGRGHQTPNLGPTRYHRKPSDHSHRRPRLARALRQHKV